MRHAVVALFLPAVPAPAHPPAEPGVSSSRGKRFLMHALKMGRPPAALDAFIFLIYITIWNFVSFREMS